MNEGIPHLSKLYKKDPDAGRMIPSLILVGVFAGNNSISPANAGERALLAAEKILRELEKAKNDDENEGPQAEEEKLHI